MSDLSQDPNYIQKPKIRHKNSLRRWFVLLAGILFIVVIALFFALRPSPKTVIEFVVQQYPTFAPPTYPVQQMVASANDYRVLQTFESQLSIQDFTVDLEKGVITPQPAIPIFSGMIPLGFSTSSTAISSNLDALWSSAGNVTMFMSSENVKQTIALNVPTKVSFSQDGSRFVVMSSLGNVLVFDTQTRSVIYELPIAFNNNQYATLNHNGTRLLISGLYANGHLFDLSSSTPQSIPSVVPQVAVEPVLLASNQIIDYTGSEIFVVDGIHRAGHFFPYTLGTIGKIQVSFDNKWLAIQTQNYLSVINLHTLLEAPGYSDFYFNSIDFDDTLFAIAFSSDNQTIGVYTFGSDNQPHLSIVDIVTMTIVASTETTTP